MGTAQNKDMTTIQEGRTKKTNAKLSLCLIKHYDMKEREGVEYRSTVLDLFTRCGQWSASRPYPGIHWIGVWMNP
jgi:hypothetical protein